jgi:hypothetical protein
MSDRIEPIRRATEVTVPAVARVAPRDRRRDDAPPRERSRRREPTAPVRRNEDGTPHVDVRA